jgi:hypothetical protein
MIDDWYAREYEPVQDLKLLWKNYRKLGGWFIKILLILSVCFGYYHPFILRFRLFKITWIKWKIFSF